MLKSQGYCGARPIPLHKFCGEYNHVSIYLFIGSLKIIVSLTYVQSLSVCVPALATWSLDIINSVLMACEVHFLFPLLFFNLWPNINLSLTEKTDDNFIKINGIVFLNWI